VAMLLNVAAPSQLGIMRGMCSPQAGSLFKSVCACLSKPLLSRVAVWKQLHIILLILFLGCYNLLCAISPWFRRYILLHDQGRNV
jgi:hypothetical protein